MSREDAQNYMRAALAKRVARMQHNAQVKTRQVLKRGAIAQAQADVNRHNPKMPRKARRALARAYAKATVVAIQKGGK